jgi:AcrR family transcriptional regulator
MAGGRRDIRRGRAKATHWRIVKAAYRLFCDQGYAGTSMARIAKAAGVAGQTVYFTFHTKAALLSRAYDFAVMREDEPQVLQEQALVSGDDCRAGRQRGLAALRDRGGRDHPPGDAAVRRRAARVDRLLVISQ